MCPLHRIHKTPLHLIEHDDSYEEQHHHKAEAVVEVVPTEGADAHGAVFEGFEDGSQGVEGHDPLSLLRHGTEGVDHGGGVHPQLYDESEQDGEVAILGGHRRYDDAKTERQACQHQDQHRKQQYMCVGCQGHVGENQVIQIHCDEESELYPHPHEVGGDGGQWHYKAREVYLPENALIVGKGRRGLVEAVGKVLPAHDPGKVKQWLWQSVGRYTGYPPKHNHIHHCSECGLYKEPGGAQDGLFILGDDITLDKHRQ